MILLDHSYPYVEIDLKNKPPFCVDGRSGKRKTTGPYPQVLGGSLYFLVLKWLFYGGEFNHIYKETFEQLKNLGYPLGLHRDTHSHNTASGCGFADNLKEIIKTLVENSEEIWKILNEVVDLKNQKGVWEKVLELVKQRNLNEIPVGNKIIQKGEDLGAEIQILDGDHQEQAAIVNLVNRTTLDVDNNQDHQAFNLDLWYGLRVGRDLGIDERKAKILSLGLYLATEMVLVERRGKSRLPIVVLEQND